MQNLVACITDPVAENFQHRSVHKRQDVIFRGDIGHVVHVVENGAEADFAFFELSGPFLDPSLQ